MNSDIARKILNNMSLTDDEVNIFLCFLCNLIREDSQIFDPMNPDCKACFDTTIKFNRTVLLRFGCNVGILDIKKELQIPLTHYASFISLNVNGDMKTYLVDMTYSQFFSDTITLDGDRENCGEVVSTQNVFGKMENELFVYQLRQKGFIELNGDILKKYIDAFLNLCGVKNKEQAYYNINNLLAKSGFGSEIKTNVK